MTFRVRQIALCTAIVAAATTALFATSRGVAAPKVPLAAESQSKLIAVLQSDAPAADKAIACKRLAVIGTKDAVPALAALLPDKELASWARIALEAIPGPEADDALRASLGKLQGRLLVGAINSIGVRRDAKAVDALASRLKDADAEVASAAAIALGRIGNAPAAKALELSLVGAELRSRAVSARKFAAPWPRAAFSARREVWPEATGSRPCGSTTWSARRPMCPSRGCSKPPVGRSSLGSRPACRS